MKSVKLIIILLFVTTVITANNFSAKVSGIILDNNTNNPLSYVTVALFNLTDSSLVTGTMSNDNGEFEIEGIYKGSYYIILNYIGYEEKIIELTEIQEMRQNIDLGYIKLDLAANDIEEVTITGKVSPVYNNVDKQIINVSGNIAAEGGTAVDALKTAPSIKINQDGEVTVRGNSNYIVLINGKPTSGEPKEVLKQTPANIIKQIEVITNPSVKYSAEGTAGIINIILKRNADNSFNGIFNAGAGTKNKYVSDLTLNFNKEKINISSGAEWKDHTATAINNYYRFLEYDDYTHEAFMGQDRKSQDKDLAFRFNLVFNPNENNSISYSMNTGHTERLLDITALTSGKTTPVTENVYAFSTYKFKQKPTYFSNNLNYTFMPAKEGSSFSLNAYYSFIDYYLFTSHHMSDADDNFSPIDDEPYRQDILNNNYSNDYQFDLDYILPINENHKFETGVSYHKYNRFLDVSFENYDYSINDWLENPLYTNNYEFNEIVYAGYINYSTQIGEFGINAGMRAELTDRALNQNTSETCYNYDKLNWFPAFSISRAFKNDHTLKFSLSDRINRPDEYMMNPFPEFEDDFFYAEGNPYLIPELSRNLELVYSKMFKKHALSARLYYTKTFDKIDQKLVIGEHEKIRAIPHNDSEDESKGLELAGNITFTKWWTMMLSTTGYHYKTEGKIDQIPFSKTNYTWNAQTVNSFHLGKTTALQIIGYYNSKSILAQGEVSDFFFVDIALKQRLLSDKLSVSIQAKDIFQSLNYTLLSTNQNMTLQGDFINESPIFMFNVSFQISKFNKLTEDVETEFDM